MTEGEIRMTLREFLEKMIEAMLALVYFRLEWDIGKSVGIELDVIRDNGSGWKEIRYNSVF